MYMLDCRTDRLFQSLHVSDSSPREHLMMEQSLPELHGVLKACMLSEHIEEQVRIEFMFLDSKYCNLRYSLIRVHTAICSLSEV